MGLLDGCIKKTKQTLELCYLLTLTNFFKCQSSELSQHFAQLWRKLVRLWRVICRPGQRLACYQLENRNKLYTNIPHTCFLVTRDKSLNYQSVKFSREGLLNLTPNLAHKPGWLHWFNTGSLTPSSTMCWSVCECVLLGPVCLWILWRSSTQQ